MFPRNPSSYTNPEPCQHLVDYKIKHGFNGYKAIQKLLVTSPIGRTGVKKPNTTIPRCSYCNGCEGRFYLCLICSSFSCLDHTLLHPQSEIGHAVFVDIERAELYCGLCRDQLYDPDFDQVVMSKHSMAGNESIGQRLIKRRRLVSGVGLDLQKLKYRFPTEDLRAKSCYPMGLRGLNNLGSTCFMNSVLQALLHAPPFRDYFSSGGHRLDACQKGTMDRMCMLCDINAVFSAVYSGDRNPYSPAQFLYRSAIVLYVIIHFNAYLETQFENHNETKITVDRSNSLELLLVSTMALSLRWFLNEFTNMHLAFCLVKIVADIYHKDLICVSSINHYGADKYS